MHMRLSAIALAVLGGTASLAMSGEALAGNVGYYKPCTFATVGNVSGVITANGHNVVPVATLDAASLSGLNALVIVDCYSNFLTAPNASLNSAVQNGMTLVIEPVYSYAAPNPTTSIASVNLPGAPTFGSTAAHAYPEADDIQIPAGSPVASGPGGTLTATSLDRIPAGSGGTYNMTHYYLRSSLPAGTIALLTTGDNDHVGAFAWNVGSGRVILSETQSTLFLPGGESAASTDAFKAGMVTYFTNLIAWAVGPATTCASEGYTGTKLTWCKNICENGLTGATLDMWIHRWVNRYRDLPYCAQEGGGEEEPVPTLK